MRNCLLRTLLPAVLSASLFVGNSGQFAFAQDDPTAAVIQQAEQLSWGHKFKPAIDLIQAQLARTPKNAALLTELATIYQNWQKPQQAVGYLQQALKIDASEPLRWSMLADAYKDLGQFPKVLESYQKLIELVPGNAESYQPAARFLVWELRQPAAALSLIEQALKVVKDPVPLYQMQAEQLESLDRYQEALDVVQNSAKAYPADSSLPTNLARLYIKLGNFDQAWAAIQTAHQAEKWGAYLALVSYGSILQENYLQRRAEETYNKAIALEPTGVEAYLNMARMESDDGKWSDAESILQKGMTATGSKAEIYNALVDASIHEKKYDQAKQMCDRAVARDPDNSAIYGLLGRLLVAQDRGDEALVAFQQAAQLQADPQSYTLQQIANAYQGWDLRNDGSTWQKDTRAAHYLELAVKRKGDDPDMWESLSNTYLRLAQFDKALTALQRSYQLKEDPDGQALALLQVASSRKNSIAGVEQGLFVMAAIAQSVPDEILEPFRESPELWSWLKQMAGPDHKPTSSTQDVLQQQEKELLQAEALAPDNPKILQALAEVQSGLGKYAPALATWTKLAQIKKVKNPQAWALNRRADTQGQNIQYVISPSLVPLWQEIEKYRDVVDATAIKVPPPLAAYLAAQWPAIKQQLRKVVVQGRPDAAKAVAMAPDSIDFHLTLARIDWFLERWDDVLVSLHHVELLSAPPPPCQGMACSAINVLQQMKSVTGEVPETYSMQYMILHLRGDMSGARQVLEQGVARRPDHPELRYRLAHAYVDAGQPDKAAAELQQLFASSPYYRRQIRRDPAFTSFLQDPRGQALLQ